MTAPKLTRIMREDFGELTPGAKLNSIIMGNVLRYTSAMTSLGRFWIKDGDTIRFPFRPSTDLHHAMRVAQIYVDMYGQCKMYIDLSITGKKHWNVTLYMAPLGGNVETVCSYSGEDTAFQICRCLVYAYLENGPKDHETNGWKHHKPRKKVDRPKVP